MDRVVKVQKGQDLLAVTRLQYADKEVKLSDKNYNSATTDAKVVGDPAAKIKTSQKRIDQNMNKFAR